MSLLINKAIYFILSGDTKVQSYVSGKTFPIFAPDETTVPFIVYDRKNVSGTYTKDGLAYDDTIVTVNIISDNYTECIELSDAVRQALELKVGVYNNIHIYQCLLSSSGEDFGVDGYITQLEFAIKSK